jgi:hypothetical protein
MKTQTILGFIVAALIAVFAVSSVMALDVNFDSVQVNDVEYGAGINTLAGMPGETVPIVVRFTAYADASDVKLKVYIEGYKSDVYATTSRFDVVNGSTYIKRLSLTLPSVEDMDGLTEDLTLRVRASDKTDEVENTYAIKMQREAYSLQFLQVDAPSKASAGEIIPIDVVVENTGTEYADNTFVTASIPELGVSKKAYLSDLYSEDDSGDNEDNARERRIYLVLPADAKSGDYTIQLTASNYDATASAKKVISVTGTVAANNQSSSDVIIPTPNTKAGIPTSVVVLTVVLVIIFVVLLVVLIVLLTKKPSDKVEDFGETSYY